VPARQEEDEMVTTTPPSVVDVAELELKVKEMYTRVALDPEGGFHFEMGRAMALRLGYSVAELDAVPPEAIQSFAGVGYYFDLADLHPGERVVDLGSGSGMDSFIAAHKTGPGGQVPSESSDAVISNGVINLSPDKAAVFREAARLLRRGGRVALADIVTDVPLPETVTCNATLWAACIGGAMQRDRYVEAIEQAGFTVTAMKANHAYRFLSKSAQSASRTYGVRSVSLLAIKN
jgi:SAM-dependent methyltransferase